MKRLLITTMAAMLLLGGCCQFTDVNGITTKTFANCFKVAQDKACNPPAAVMEVVNSAAPLLVNILNILVPGTAPFINAANAIESVITLQTTGCLSLTKLNQLIAYLESVDFQMAKEEATKVKGLKAAPVVNVQPLKEWAGKYQ